MSETFYPHTTSRLEICCLLNFSTSISDYSCVPYVIESFCIHIPSRSFFFTSKRQNYLIAYTKKDTGSKNGTWTDRITNNWVKIYAATSGNLSGNLSAMCHLDFWTSADLLTNILLCMISLSICICLDIKKISLSLSLYFYTIYL